VADDDTVDAVVLRALQGQEPGITSAPAPISHYTISAPGQPSQIINNTTQRVSLHSQLNQYMSQQQNDEIQQFFDMQDPTTCHQLIYMDMLDIGELIRRARATGLDGLGQHRRHSNERLQYYVQMKSWSWADPATPSAAALRKKEPDLLANLMRLYHASITGDVRSPMIHVVGPAGSGKSRACAELARAVKRNLHVINVSRLSPLEIEGLQMPTKNNEGLKLLLNTIWSRIEEGDVVLFDEFLRGFPEVYNGLLDILTSRHVMGYDLPNAFFIGASNSIATYDDALEDRLLNLFVDDPRTDRGERTRIAKVIVEACGMHPSMVTHYSMEELIDTEIVPMYRLLDQFNGQANITRAQLKGHSPRNLIGQVHLREIQSLTMKQLIESNNREAMKSSQYQFVILPTGANADPAYVTRARKLQGNPKLTPIQSQNLDLNLQLVEMDEVLRELDQEEEPDDLVP
jgi:hypothetical protein